MREVHVAWNRAAGPRVPIVDARNFEFGERVVARFGRRSFAGIVGWDPTLGWVLYSDHLPDRGRTRRNGATPDLDEPDG